MRPIHPHPSLCLCGARRWNASSSKFGGVLGGSTVEKLSPHAGIIHASDFVCEKQEVNTFVASLPSRMMQSLPPFRVVFAPQNDVNQVRKRRRFGGGCAGFLIPM